MAPTPLLGASEGSVTRLVHGLPFRPAPGRGRPQISGEAVRRQHF